MHQVLVAAQGTLGLRDTPQSLRQIAPGADVESVGDLHQHQYALPLSERVSVVECGHVEVGDATLVQTTLRSTATNRKLTARACRFLCGPGRFFGC